jgi:predicted DCC family thiol-disulfide oxidoreductase YuxK
MTRLFRLLYDGDCPICRREVAWLKRRDNADNLVCEDISALGFDPFRYGLTREEVNRELHGVQSDGTVLRGMEAVRQAYQSVGLGLLVAPTRLPGMRFLTDQMYRWFARNRLALGKLIERDCPDGSCNLADTRRK